MPPDLQWSITRELRVCPTNHPTQYRGAERPRKTRKIMNLPALNRLARKPFHSVLDEAPDQNDFALLNDCFGVPVTFLYAGSPGIVARKQVSGVIVDVKTTRKDRYVLVKVEGLPFPKWVNLNQVQFVSESKTLSTAIKSASVEQMA